MAKVRQRVVEKSFAVESNDDPATIWREDYGISKECKLYPKTPSSLAGKALPVYSMAEVAKHNTKDDCWIVLDERVYEVTKFIDSHPGGVGPIVNMAGKDATDVFANYHAARVYEKMLPAYLIGKCNDAKVYEHVLDFREARQEMLKQGLFETDYGWYAKLTVWLVTLFLSALALSLGLIGGGGTCARMIGAAMMGIFWQQLAGLGHDLGHSGVTHNFHKDHMIGSALAAFMGLSIGWWKSDHNTHHIVCNAVEHDPNIQHMPLLAITDKIYKEPFYDTYHKRTVRMDAVAKFLVGFQHILFYPVMAIARWNLYAQGILFLLSGHDTTHYKWTELTGICMFFSWMFTVAFSMPTGWETFGWMMVSHGVAGILHVQIVLSHWSMETYMGTPYTDKDTEWYLMQLRTTMNVATNPWLDFIHIGLQFQIEHHLFPRLPRHNLRKARVHVKRICKKHNIYYHEPGFFAGNLEMWKALRVAAMGARKTVRDEGNGGYYVSALKRSKLWAAVNCEG
jgi:delta8-fatty-acid desaturase